MSGTIVRLILGVLLIVSTPVVCAVGFIVLETTVIRDDEVAIVTSEGLTAAYLLAGWILIWAWTIRWSPTRIALTSVSPLIAAMPAMVVGVMVGLAVRHSDAVWLGTFIGGIVWAPIWLAVTTLIWRETHAERAERLKRVGINAIACPSCGYNLTGLRESVCPECGAAYTLDQLFAALADDRRDPGDA